MSLASGARLGPYEVLAPLGAGGMGEVYKARDSRLDRLVAVKILPPAMALSDDARERFEREARSISRLSHPHVCALFDVGREGDTLYLVMELLDGETLKELVARGPLKMTGGASHRRRDRRGAGCSSESRDHPSRPEAGQRDVDALRGQASRLRIGQDARGGRRSARRRTGNGGGADGAGHVAGHGALHVARAVRGPRRRRAKRCLRARSCSLRDGDRRPRICAATPPRASCPPSCASIRHPPRRSGRRFPHSSIASFVNVSRRTRTAAGSRRTTSRCSLRRSLSAGDQSETRLGGAPAAVDLARLGGDPSSPQPSWRRV